MKTTKKIVLLVQEVEKAFIELSSVDANERFGEFITQKARTDRFKELCDGLTQEDIDSLNLDSPATLSDHEFEIHDLVFELIEGFGKLPKSEVKFDLPLKSEGKTVTLISSLVECCIKGDTKAAKKIVSMIGVNIVDHNCQTPLMYAVGNCRVEMVQMLLQNGADPNLISPRIKTAMHYCGETIASQEIFDLLKKAGGRTDIEDARGVTAGTIIRENKIEWLS